MNSEDEQRIINSFQSVKEDMTKIYESLKFALKKIDDLEQENKKLNSSLAKIKSTKRVSQREQGNTFKKKFIASKNGKKVHQANCMHARNIKKRIIFKSKTEALNEGYSLCSCLAY